MESSAMNTTSSPVGPRHAGVVRRDQNVAEEMRHHLEIEQMARQSGRPISEITELYVGIYADLKLRAKVTDYLPVFVARRIRGFLSKH